jgi:alpha-glucosidase (family GH31 glycosyl hydrolase)
MLGPDLLVAPVFTADGAAEFHLPEGTWTHLVTGERVLGPVSGATRPMASTACRCTSGRER